MAATIQLQVLVLLLLWMGCLRAQVTAPTGALGPKGPAGENGAPGIKGENGDVGIPGEPGATGATGAQGSTGSTGAQGIKGEMGAKGDEGAAGVLGILGATGDLGVEGEQGATGSTGSTGATGVTGAIGSRGMEGDRGAVGADGSPGELGDKGEKGANGIQGVTGDSGDVGPVGERGKSLIELDVDECATLSSNECDMTSTECVNWATGYRCPCKPGFKPSNLSEFKCDDIDECVVDNGDCPGKCINTIGGYSCECPDDTKLTQNKQCSDVNECLDGTANCASNVNTYCINKYNGYSCANSQDSIAATTAKASVAAAQTLSKSMMTSTWVIILLAWFAILTFIAIIILIWLIYVFHKMKRDKIRRQQQNSMYDAHGEDEGGSDDEMQMPEGMAGSADMIIDVPRPSRSHRGTMKGASRGKSYKGGSRPGSVSSSTGRDMKTASIKQTRVATGERNTANRLSGVDTFY